MCVYGCLGPIVLHESSSDVFVTAVICFLLSVLLMLVVSMMAVVNRRLAYRLDDAMDFALIASALTGALSVVLILVSVVMALLEV